MTSIPSPDRRAPMLDEIERRENAHFPTGKEVITWVAAAIVFVIAVNAILPVVPQ